MTHYDPIGPVWDLDDVLVGLDALCGRVRRDLLVANRVFDALRAAPLAVLEAHADAVYRLMVALPPALSLRLLCLAGAHLDTDVTDREPRQSYWRRIYDRMEIAYLEAKLAG